MSESKKFSIVIATKNRLPELQITLAKIAPLLQRQDVKCIICDDGSSDGTSKYIELNYPQITLHRNEISKGYLHSRNKLLAMSDSEYAISLDDDAHFLSADPLEQIENAFNENPECGLLAFRIFWGTNPPQSTATRHKQQRVKSFVGCGHAWRMAAWKSIPDYPEWYVFYGEEDFASFQLFKTSWHILYVPEVLVHHRVDLGLRKLAKDHNKRLRRSLAAGWFNYLLFVPLHKIPRKMAASVYMQFRTRILKGNPTALKALVLAFTDVLTAIPKIRANSNRFTDSDYADYFALEEARLYWKPENDTD